MFRKESLTCKQTERSVFSDISSGQQLIVLYFEKNVKKLLRILNTRNQKKLRNFEY